VRRFDSYAVKPGAKPGVTPDADTGTAVKKVDWVRVSPFIALHAACLAVFWVGWSWVAIGVAVAGYVLRMFAITGFCHRYFSHRTYNTTRFAQFLFALAGNSAVQRGPLWWAAHHRQHHRYSDQVEDPHSPKQHGFIWSHMLWITSRENFATGLKEVRDLSRYPELIFLDRFDILVPVILGTAMYSLGFALESLAPGLGTNGWQLLVWGFFVSTVVLFHGTCTINSLSHLFGSRRFATAESSRNNPLLALITFGEGWHNNHHHFPGAVRQGFYWWEYDLTYYGLKIMSWLGIIWGLNKVPARVYEQARLEKANG
jgi:stearoyl-CoA desaturase (delta-9 desaturase)